MSGRLTEQLRVRLDKETETELAAEAKRDDRPPGYLARTFIRDGLKKRRQARERASRGS